MKKIITKYGLSALCGSLAVMSGANAGEVKVLGNAHLTWTSVRGVTGQPLGMKTNLSFVGSGELDGGQTFSMTVAHDDQNAWSSSNITLNTNNLGTLKLSMAEGGGGIGGYDDNMPRAFEETWDAGVGTNINLQKGVGSSTNVSWVTPRMLATTLQIAYTPQNDGTQPNDKSIGGSSNNSSFNEGTDVVLNINPSWGAFGTNLFIGASLTDQERIQGAFIQDLGSDHEEAVVGLVLDLGPLQVGAQGSAENTGAQTIGNVEYYGNTSIGAALNINDNLSISYSEGRSIQAKIDDGNNATTGSSGGFKTRKEPSKGVGAGSNTPKTEMTSESWQIAYTIGGVALKYSDTDWTNPKYTKNTNDSAKILSLSMAF